MQPDTEINGIQKVDSLKSSTNNNLGSRQSIDIVNQTRNKSKDSITAPSTVKTQSPNKKNGKALFIIVFTILVIAVFMGLLYLAYLKSK